ncbi:MAG: hypothetical protein JWM47_1543 [Acidimicrobiales bacterium]|nr:hypothetical protein [Acidimicrobiales bacterium]
MPTDTPTRVANDLFEAAAGEGALEQRSAKGQIDYWARIGQKVSTRHRVAAAHREVPDWRIPVDGAQAR